MKTSLFIPPPAKIFSSMVLILALISFLLMVSPLTFAQEIIESNPAALSPQAASELTKKSFSYEFVEFPIDKLAKAITKRKNTVLIKLGKHINDTWTIEENELRYDNLGLPKWDEAGNPLPNKPAGETYLATSANKQLNIRFTLTNGELSGFVHDLTVNTMTHFRSISMMTTFDGKDKEKNKLAIYTEKFQSPPPSRASQRATVDCSRKWLIIAVETDVEFPDGNTLLDVLNHVEYIFDLNFGFNIYFRKYQWSTGGSYPYSGVPTVTIPGSGAIRTNISELFTRFETQGWGRNQGCHLMHLLTGKKLGSGFGLYGGDARNRQIDCNNGAWAASLSSSEFQNESIEQIARVMAHELGHNLAATGSHEKDSPYNGTCIDETNYIAGASPSNKIMCVSFRTSPNSDQLIGARTPYFSTNFQNNIIANVAPISCVQSPPNPVFGQAYFNGDPINNTPYFANTRNATITIDIGSILTPTFNRSVTPASIFLGSPSVSGVDPNYSGLFTFNAPNSVNNATFVLTTTVPCTATATRTIPVVFGSAYRLGPNPAQTTLTVEFLLDKETPNLPDFLPESVVLVSDKNKEVKRSEPKKNAASKNSVEATKVVWDLTDVATDTYYLHVRYSKDVIFKERILIQK
jgi:Metallo-peptidase family M12